MAINAEDKLRVILEYVEKNGKVMDTANKRVKDMDKGVKGLAGSLKGMLPGSLAQFAGVAGAITAVGTAIGFSVREAMDGQREQAQLAAVLRSTEHAAGLSADELNKMALELSRLTTYSDGAINETQALMLTFTSISKDIFPDALAITLDMSTALGQDLKSSAIQVGKALQDPILGVTALRRVGVNFTKDQQDMIKTMVETGKTAEAQKFIMAELNKEFGGSAAAQAGTYAGQIQQLKNELEVLGGTIGEELLPDLQLLVTDVKELTMWVTENYDAIKEWGNRIIWLSNPLGKLGGEAGKALRDLLGLGDATGENEDAMVGAGYAAGGLAGELDGLADSADDAADAEKEAAKAAKELSAFYKDLLSTAAELNKEEEKFAEDAEARAQKLKDIEQEKVRLQMEQNGVQAAGNLTLEERNKFMLQQIELDNEYNQILAEGTKAEEDRAEANKQRVFDLVEARLAQDNLTSEEFEYLQNLQVQMGLVTQADADKAIQISKSADEFVSAFEQQSDEVNTLSDALNQISKDSPYRAQIVIETIGGIPTLSSFSGGGAPSGVLPGFAGYQGLGGYADGGSFTVPGVGSGDRPYLVNLEPGERVDVTPNGQVGGGNTIININATVNGEQDWDYVAQRIKERLVR